MNGSSMRNLPKPTLLPTEYSTYISLLLGLGRSKNRFPSKPPLNCGLADDCKTHASLKFNSFGDNCSAT